MDEYEEQEAKLIPVPAGVATFQAELRRFQQERGCSVVGIRAGQIATGNMLVLLIRMLGLGISVWTDSSVRDGHVVLVGGGA